MARPPSDWWTEVPEWGRVASSWDAQQNFSAPTAIRRQTCSAGSCRERPRSNRWPHRSFAHRARRSGSAPTRRCRPCDYQPKPARALGCGDEGEWGPAAGATAGFPESLFRWWEDSRHELEWGETTACERCSSTRSDGDAAVDNSRGCREKFCARATRNCSRLIHSRREPPPRVWSC